MKPSVIALSGKIGSGKSALASSLAERLSWKRASFGDCVRTVAIARGLEPTGPNLQEVGASLVESGWETFCRAVLAQTEWQPGQPLVIDGIRHVAAVSHLKRLVHPIRLALVHVEVDEALRAERIARRITNGGDKDGRDECHSTERDVKITLPAAADLVVDGARPMDELVGEIIKHFDMRGDWCPPPQ